VELLIVTLKTLLPPCVVGFTFVAKVEEKLSSETSYDTLLTGEPAPKVKVKITGIVGAAVKHCVILATVGVGKFGNTVAVATCCRVVEVQPGLLGSSKSAK
jgi:hypothetical protein